MLRSFGNYISNKRGFLRASVLLVGVPFGLFMSFAVEQYGPPAVVISLLVAPFAGLLWGVGMWELHFKHVFSQQGKVEPTAHDGLSSQRPGQHET